MKCPKCNSDNITTAKTINGLIVQRYKKCKKCNYSFVTIEAIYVDQNWITYRDYLIEIGELESYSEGT